MEKHPLESGKTVLLSDPYDPQKSLLPPLQGRAQELRMILASWIARDKQPPLCPLMVGEPGVGKNRIVYELAALTGLPLYIIQGHEDITAEDLACAVRFADDGHRMDYVLSPLVTAMHRGAICFIDEIGKIRPRALALLVSVLDDRRYIDSTLLGERVVAATTFRFVAATNTGEVSGLPEFIRSRMRPVIPVGYPLKEEINEIAKSCLGDAAADQDALLNEFWKEWKSEKLPPTPRDIIHLLSLAMSLSEYRHAATGHAVLERESGAAAKLVRKRASTAQLLPEDIRTAFRELFRHDSA